MDIWDDLGIVAKYRVFGTRMSELKSQLGHLLLLSLVKLLFLCISLVIQKSE